MPEPFYITLPSNASKDYYPENKISEFRTKLKNAISLPENWEMGLCELIFPANWDNVVRGGNNVTFRRRAGKITTPDEVSNLRIEGVYHDIDTLLGALNEALNTEGKGDGVFTYVPIENEEDDGEGGYTLGGGNVKITLPNWISKITLDTQLALDLGIENPEIIDEVISTKDHMDGLPFRLYSFTVYIKGKEMSFEDNVERTYPIPVGHYEAPKEIIKNINALMVAILGLPKLGKREGFYVSNGLVGVKLPYDGIEVEMDWPLAALLGFEERVISGMERESAEYPFDVKNNFYSLFIYSDVIQPQIIGDTYAQLLQVTPAPQRTNNIISHTFNPVQYVPLQKSHFETIEIAIRNSAGDLIPFTTGLSIVKLHFRPRS